MTNSILTQTNSIVTPTGPLTVRLTRSMRTTETGFIIPAGTVGRVLEYNPTTNKFMVDFGIANYAQAIDPRSDVIELVGVRYA
ncbi:MAG: hypothetical protein Kow0031_28940 [Anaerolineae bacterium]